MAAINLFSFFQFVFGDSKRIVEALLARLRDYKLLVSTLISFRDYDRNIGKVALAGASNDALVGLDNLKEALKSVSTRCESLQTKRLEESVQDTNPDFLARLFGPIVQRFRRYGIYKAICEDLEECSRDMHGLRKTNLEVEGFFKDADALRVKYYKAPAIANLMQEIMSLYPTIIWGSICHDDGIAGGGWSLYRIFSLIENVDSDVNAINSEIGYFVTLQIYVLDKVLPFCVQKVAKLRAAMQHYGFTEREFKAFVRNPYFMQEAISYYVASFPKSIPGYELKIRMDAHPEENGFESITTEFRAAIGAHSICETLITARSYLGGRTVIDRYGEILAQANVEREVLQGLLDDVNTLSSILSTKDCQENFIEVALASQDQRIVTALKAIDAKRGASETSCEYDAGDIPAADFLTADLMSIIEVIHKALKTLQAFCSGIRAVLGERIGNISSVAVGNQPYLENHADPVVDYGLTMSPEDSKPLDPSIVLSVSNVTKSCDGAGQSVS